MCTPERARELLKEYDGNETFSVFSQDYFQAIAESTLPRFYRDWLRFKKGYSDDLPEPDVPRDHPDYTYIRLEAGWNHPSSPFLKCLGNVIGGISMSLKGCIDDEIVFDSEIYRLVDHYRSHNWNYARGKKGEYWTLPEEIQLINTTLDVMIGYLERTYSLVPMLPR